MNRIATTPRGFPFDEKTLAELQEQTVPVLNALAKLVPDNSIIYGCDFNYELMRRNDGFILWNGELLPFVGGPPSAQFSILEEVQVRTFNVGTDQDPQLEDHPAYYKRYAKVGNIPGAEGVFDSIDLNRPPRFLSYLNKGRKFIGTVVPNGAGVEATPNIKIMVLFDNIYTSNYMVLGSFHHAAGGGTFHYEIVDRGPTSFGVILKDISAPISSLKFDYL